MFLQCLSVIHNIVSFSEGHVWDSYKVLIKGFNNFSILGRDFTAFEKSNFRTYSYHIWNFRFHSIPITLNSSWVVNVLSNLWFKETILRCYRGILYKLQNSSSTLLSYNIISMSKRLYANQILLDRRLLSLLNMYCFLGTTFWNTWRNLKNLNILNLNELKDIFY